MRYVVDGTDLRTGRAVREVIDAASLADVENAARRMSIQVLAVRAATAQADTAPTDDAHDDDDEAPDRGDPLSTPAAARRGTRRAPEAAVWNGTPSQWPNVLWILPILTIPYALYRMLDTRCHRIELTSERLRIETGILSRHLEEIELYRVKDSGLTRSFFQRLVGLGTVHLSTSDETMPEVHLANIRDAQGLRERIRRNVELVRRARGVRELDVS